MPVHRVICRCDFSFRPELLDSPGKCYTALGGDAWPEFQENQGHTHTLRWLDEDGSRFRSISFGPTFTAFNIEWRDGVQASKLADNPDLIEMLRSLDKVRNFASAHVIRRAGIRFYDFDSLVPQEDGQVAAEVPKAGPGAKALDEEYTPQRLLRPFLENGAAGMPVSARMEEHLGPAADILWRQIGKHEDGTKYAVVCGPVRYSEKHRYFEEIHQTWSDHIDYDFIVDCDLSELDFEMKVSTKSWASPLIVRFAKMVSSVKGAVQGKKS